MASDTEQHHEMKAHADVISYCKYLNNEVVITSSYDKSIGVWDAAPCKLKQRINGHTQRIVSCALDTCCKTILSGSWDKTIMYWDIESCKLLWTGNHSSQVTCCDLHGSTKTAISGCDSGQLFFWDTRTKNRTRTLNGHGSTVSSCRIAHNGQKLCSTSLDNKVHVWDIRSNRCLLKLNDHSNSVSSCVFTNMDSHLATTSWDKTIRIYDVTVGTFRTKGPVVLQHDGCVSSCCFSSNDQLLLTCGFDKTVNLWDMNTCSVKKCYKGHSSWIYWVDFCPLSKWFITGSKQGILGFWNSELDYVGDHTGEFIFGSDRKLLIQNKCFKCGLICPRENNSDQEPSICVFCRLK